MRFQLGTSTIKVILDTQHLNIISIILCFDIFLFVEQYIITPYMLLFEYAYIIRLNPSCCILVAIHNRVINVANAFL